MSDLAVASTLAHLLEFNPYHDASGRFTSEGSAKTRSGPPSAGAMDIARTTFETGGASVRMEGGVAKKPKKGYMIGIKGYAKTVPAPKDEGDLRSLAREIDTYQRERAGVLGPKGIPGSHTGLWQDGGKVYLDVSKQVNRKSRAYVQAHHTGEKAIWDVAQGNKGNYDRAEIITQGAKSKRQARAYKHQAKAHKRKMKARQRKIHGRESIALFLAEMADEITGV